jgi:hypothetical protein
MDFEQAFPLRFWINLGRREDRRVETEARLDEIGIRAERFAAVDARWMKKKPKTRAGNQASKRGAGKHVTGTNLGFPTNVDGDSDDVRGYGNAGRYALALTQRLAIREAARRKASAVLLLEDDIVFHPNFRVLIEAVDLPEDWGIFYIGCTHNVPPVWAGRRVVRARWAVDTHAIAVSLPYYKMVMEILDRRAKPNKGVPKASDQFIALLHKEVPTYACYPNLAWQDVSGSDLLGSEYSSYMGDGLQANWTDSVTHLLPELVGERIELGKSAAMMRVAPFAKPMERDDISVPFSHEKIPLRVWVRKQPKLGLLFLTRADVIHPAIWREFVAESPDRVRVFSHVKNPAAVESGFLKQTRIREHFQTEWGGIGLVQASRAMLLEALKDESLTHFVLLSESCVPVRPLPEILRRLELDPRPQFGFSTIKNAHPKHVRRTNDVPQVPEGCWRFQSQWWLLDRISAFFAAGQDFTELFGAMEVPDEAYFSTVLAMQGYPLEGSVLKKDVTWTWWVNHGSPIAWDTIPIERLHDIIHSGALFARKFPKGADIGKYGLHRSVGQGAVEKIRANC